MGLLVLLLLSVAVAIDIGPQLIRAVDQIGGSTPNANIEQLAASISAELNRAGVRNTRWVLEMLYQKRGAHLGVQNDRSLFTARVALGVRLGVIGDNGRRILLSKVGAAANSASRGQSESQQQPRSSGGSNTPKGFQETFGRLAMPGRSTAHLSDQVRDMMRSAGFRDAAIQTAVSLMRVQSRLATAGTGQNLYGGVNGLEAYRNDMREYNRLAGVAAQQGVIPLSTQRAISSFTGEQLVTWRQKTPEEIAANNRARVQQNGDLIRKANDLLRELRELRQYVDSKNGFVQTGLGDASVIVRLIGGISARGQMGGILGTLNAALSMPDTEYQKIDRVRAAYISGNSYITQLRPRGANTVAFLREKRENGYNMLGRVASVAGFIPVIGKPLSITLTNLEGGMRYLSGDITASEAVAKGLSSIVGGTLGKKIVGTGSLVSQSIRSTLYSMTNSLTVDLARILSDRNLNGDQRSDAIRKAIGRAVLSSFQAGVSKAVSGGIAMNDNETRAKVYEQFKSVGEKYGLEPYVMKPILDQLK